MVTLVQAAMGRLKSMVRRVSSPSDRRVARQTFWMGSMTAVEVVRGLAQVAITARILGPEGFGALAVIVAASTLVHGLVALPGGDTVTTFVTRSVTEGRREDAGAILRLTMVVSQGLSLAAYAVIAVLALTASSLLGISESHVNALLLYGLLGVSLATRSETLAVLRLADRVNIGLVVTLVAALTSLGLILLAWRTGGGLPEVVTAYVAAAAVSGIGMFAAAAASTRKAGVGGFLTSVSLRSPSDVVRFQYGTFARTKLGTLSQNLDSVLMAQLAAPAEVGIYRAARGIMDMARRPFQLIRFGVQPEYSRQWYSGQGGRVATFVSPSHHHVALGGRRWVCAARHTTQAHYSARTRGRVCGGFVALAYHDSWGLRREHCCVQRSSCVYGPDLACPGVWHGSHSGVGSRPAVARASVRGRWCRMGQNDLRAGLCADIVALHCIDSKAGPWHANGYGSGGKEAVFRKRLCFTRELTGYFVRSTD